MIGVQFGQKLSVEIIHERLCFRRLRPHPKLDIALFSQWESEPFMARAREIFRAGKVDEAWWMTLVPLAMARVQWALLRGLDAGKAGSDLKVAIIERDVPCGDWAMEDLRLLLSNLAAASGMKVPEWTWRSFHAGRFSDVAESMGMSLSGMEAVI